MKKPHVFQSALIVVFPFVLFVSLPGVSQAGEPLENCPVDILAMVEICNGNCTWMNYCKYLGFGTDINDVDARRIKTIARAPCVDLCNERHDNLQGREACYEDCGVHPRSFAQEIRILAPDCRKHSMPDDPRPGPYGSCRASFAANIGVVDSSENLESPGFTLQVDFEYQLTRRFALELSFGRGEIVTGIESPELTGVEPSELTIDHLSLKGKYYFLEGRTRPFIGLGLGLYDVAPGSQENGFNALGGVSYGISRRASFELVGTYHSIEIAETDLDLFNVTGGLRFHF